MVGRFQTFPDILQAAHDNIPRTLFRVSLSGPDGRT